MPSNDSALVFEPLPAPDGAAPYDYSSDPWQRRRVREIAEYARSDIFERVGSNSENTSAVWESPLKWRVEYGHMAKGPTWLRIYSPGGELFRETLDGDVYWLAENLP